MDFIRLWLHNWIKNWTPVGLNWTILLKCLEMIFVVIWCHTNKTVLINSVIQFFFFNENLLFFSRGTDILAKCVGFISSPNKYIRLFYTSLRVEISNKIQKTTYCVVSLSIRLVLLSQSNSHNDGYATVIYPNSWITVKVFIIKAFA